jgi:choline transport protein
MSQLVVQMYFLYHDDLVIEQWHIFIPLVIICWACVALTVFANRLLPYLQSFGLFMVTVGGLITIIVLAAMPKQRASNSFVWKDFENQTGWSNGVAFLTGVLNGAFTIGTVDGVTHLAEELPNPKSDLPKAVFAQVGLGGLCTFF